MCVSELITEFGPGGLRAPPKVSLVSIDVNINFLISSSLFFYAHCFRSVNLYYVHCTAHMDNSMGTIGILVQAYLLTIAITDFRSFSHPAQYLLHPPCIYNVTRRGLPNYFFNEKTNIKTIILAKVSI